MAGKPATCLSASLRDSPVAIGARILLYRGGSRVRRNDLPEACPGLDDDAIIVSEIHGGQVCRNDQIHTLQRGGIGVPGPRCRLGDFTPWEKPGPSRPAAS